MAAKKQNISDDTLRWCSRLEALSFRIKHRDDRDYTQLLIDLESAQDLLIDALSAKAQMEQKADWGDLQTIKEKLWQAVATLTTIDSKDFRQRMSGANGQVRSALEHVERIFRRQRGEK